MDYHRSQVTGQIRWQKVGLIFRPDADRWWMRSHAALPVPLHVSGDLYRIYFASRDQKNRSHVGHFEVNLTRPHDILAISKEPVLSPGDLGCFDDHGVYPASAVRYGGQIYLYTIGWSPGSPPPLFYSSIGLATSVDEGLTFAKYSNVPIMARSEYDPCLVTSPVVLRERDRWRMWYVSGYRWELENDIPRSIYHVKYAESVDGVDWKREGVVCLDHAAPDEKNIARVCVIHDDNVYHAWFSTDRGKGYRIGYACSADGLRWQRQPNPNGLTLSESGWDSEAMAYPYVVRHAGRLYMFYNGNGFGRDGVGLAIAEAN